MASRQEPIYTLEEYLVLERDSEVKHEYLNGRVYAMAGATPNHNRVQMNLARDIGTQIRGRQCEAFGSDMRVRIPETGLYTYPDLSVVCGEPRFEHHVLDFLMNPTVLIEVLSKATASYDRGEKFRHYREISSLQEYVLFEQDRAHADHYARAEGAGDRWVLTAAHGLDAKLELPAIGCSLAMRDVYERVELLPDPPLRAVYERPMFAGYAPNETST